MPKLVELNTCYFDDLYVNCFVVFTDEVFIKWSDRLENFNGKLKWYFDDSIPVEWDSGKDFYDKCTISHLTDEEAVVLQKLFPTYNPDSGLLANFGTHCSIFNSILEIEKKI